MYVHTLCIYNCYYRKYSSQRNPPFDSSSLSSYSQSGGVVAVLYLFHQKEKSSVRIYTHQSLCLSTLNHPCLPRKRPFVQSLNDGDASTQLHYHRHAKQRDRPVTDEKQDRNHQQQQDADGAPEERRRQEKQTDKNDAEDGTHGGEGGDSKGRNTSSESVKGPEFLEVRLQDARISVQCPICLGIIRKTRTILSCMHRFCKECIDKSIRLGNKECPTCRSHCASRRAMRDDPTFDVIIATLYPDIDKYEEQELTLLEEEKARNKKVQASIAKIAKLQSQALKSRRRFLLGKNTASALSPELPNHCSAHSSRANQAINIQGSKDDGKNENKSENDSSSPGQRSAAITQIKRRRQNKTQPSHPSSSTEANDVEGTTETDNSTSKDDIGFFPALVSHPELPTWGPRGVRSHSRHGSNKSFRSNRLSKFANYLQNLDENNVDEYVHLLLVPVDKETTPRLQRPHLCCRPSLSIKHLSEYVARRTNLQAEEVEMFSLKECLSEQSANNYSLPKPILNLTDLGIEQCKAELKIVEGHESLGSIRESSISARGYLILTYRRMPGRDN